MVPETETDWNSHSESIQRPYLTFSCLCSWRSLLLVHSMYFQKETMWQAQEDSTTRAGRPSVASRHAWLEVVLTGDMEASPDTGHSTLGSVSDYSTREVLKKWNEDISVLVQLDLVLRGICRITNGSLACRGYICLKVTDIHRASCSLLLCYGDCHHPVP